VEGPRQNAEERFVRCYLYQASLIFVHDSSAELDLRSFQTTVITLCGAAPVSRRVATATPKIGGSGDPPHMKSGFLAALKHEH
jgi:hypothetical protein